MYPKQQEKFCLYQRMFFYFYLFIFFFFFWLNEEIKVFMYNGKQITGLD